MRRRYGLFAMTVLLETNDEVFVEAADLSLGRFDVPAAGRPLRLRLLSTDEPRREAGEWRVAYRTDGRMYTVTTPDSVAVADLAAGEAVAFVGAELRAEIRAIRRELVEGLSLAMASADGGYCAVHAAGIARGGWGVGLVGPAGAGKSTLTLAAARRGFEVFAEDAIYARAEGDELELWGLPWIQRLLPDALGMFPELEGVMPRLQANGEHKIEVDLDEWYPGRARPRARPAAMVLLDRRPGPTRLAPVAQSSRSEVEVYWAWGDHWTPDHELAAERIAQLPLYRLEIGGTPDEALDALDPLLDELATARVPS
jgi:hypothetical protein